MVLPSDREGVGKEARKGGRGRRDLGSRGQKDTLRSSRSTRKLGWNRSHHENSLLPKVVKDICFQSLLEIFLKVL